MAFPTTTLDLAYAIGSQFLSAFFGGTVPHSAGINILIDDLKAVQNKLGLTASTPSVNTVLKGTGTGTSGWGAMTPSELSGSIPYSKLSLGGSITSSDIADGTVTNDDINNSAAIAITKLAPWAAKNLLVSTGALGGNSATGSPTINGTLIAEGSLVAGVTTAGATGEIKATSHARIGGKIYPGGPVNTNSTISMQCMYVNGSHAGNTAQGLASFPTGVFWIIDMSNVTLGSFWSNSVATLTDKASDPVFVFGTGADPGASTSKIWLSMTGGTLQVYNRFAAAQSLMIFGFGAN